MDIDPNIYISVLIEQRNQALNAAAVLQTSLIQAQEELKELKKHDLKPLEAVK